MPATTESMNRFAHADAATGVTFTTDGSHIITSGDDFAVRFFCQKDPTVTEQIGTQDQVTCIVANATHLYTGSQDCSVRQYDITTHECIELIERCTLAVRCLALSSDSKLLAIGSEEVDIRLVNLENAEKSLTLKGHSKAVNALSFSPGNEYLISSSCDGTVKIWDLRPKNSTLKSLSHIESIHVKSPFPTSDPAKIPLQWHPTGEFFVIGAELNVMAYETNIWKKAFTYRVGIPSPTEKGFVAQNLSFSINGKYLAVATVDAEICVWNFKHKDKPLYKTANKKRVTDLAWCPNLNRLAFVDTDGEMGRWDDVIEDDRLPMPFDDPTAKKAAAGGATGTNDVNSLFDDRAMEDKNGEDAEDMDDDLDMLLGEDRGVSDNESLADFVVDDEGGQGGYLSRKAGGRGGRSGTTGRVGGIIAGRMANTVAMPNPHPRFQPGATELQIDRRYLAFNLLGMITSVRHEGGHSTVSVEFHDKGANRGFNITDNYNYSMACLGESGALFASSRTKENPSVIFYKTHDSWAASKSEWQVLLPKREDVVAIAVNGESVVVATSRGYIRVFSQSGIQTNLFYQPNVIAAAGKDDMVMLVYRIGAPWSNQVGYSLYNVETGQRIQRDMMPIGSTSDDGNDDDGEELLTWIGFSEAGIPACYTNRGVLYIMNMYRRVDQAQWTPILDTTTVENELKTKQHYWPVGLSESEKWMKCVQCRPRETEPSFPKPFLVNLPFQIPLLNLEREEGQLEEQYLRLKILDSLANDENIATASLDRRLDQDEVIKQELVQDSKALMLINLACQAERTQKALDWTVKLNRERSMDKAVEVAHHNNQHGLMERMSRIKEIKMASNEGRDFEAERAGRVMQTPEIMLPPGGGTNGGAGRFRVPTMEEEEAELLASFSTGKKRQTSSTSSSSSLSSSRNDRVGSVFSRPTGSSTSQQIQPNDPFGRRVVKEKTTTSGSNPFKKKSVAVAPPPPFKMSRAGSGGGSFTESTRQASGVFDDVRHLARRDQEQANSVVDVDRDDEDEESVVDSRKRKAVGGGAKNDSHNNNGQSRLLFGNKANTANNNNSTTEQEEAKKRRMVSETPESEFGGGGGRRQQSSVEDGMVLPDIEDEDMMFEDDLESVPAGQQIPATQSSSSPSSSLSRGASSSKLIEETRSSLERTTMASPAKASGVNSLAGFRFHKK